MGLRGTAVPGLLLAAALAACAKPAPPPPPPAPPAPSVDGRYRGTARLVRAETRGCPRSGARVLEVQGNAITLSYRLSPRQLVQLQATATADGTLQASDGTGTLSGTLRNGQLDVTVSSPMCENRWVLTKVD